MVLSVVKRRFVKLGYQPLMNSGANHKTKAGTQAS